MAKTLIQYTIDKRKESLWKSDSWEDGMTDGMLLAFDLAAQEAFTKMREEGIGIGRAMKVKNAIKALVNKKID